MRQTIKKQESKWEKLDKAEKALYAKLETTEDNRRKLESIRTDLENYDSYSISIHNLYDLDGSKYYGEFEETQNQIRNIVQANYAYLEDAIEANKKEENQINDDISETHSAKLTALYEEEEKNGY